MGETLVEEGKTLESSTVKIYRTATVVKGGRRFSFAALVVVGDRKGSVGIGYGKAPGVPAAIEKAQKSARKTLVRVELQEGTLPHEVKSKFGASMVKLVPAAPGTGVIAGATVRTVLELAGVRDCLTKSFGSNNQKNLLKAAYDGLMRLRSKAEIAELRSVSLDATEVEKRLEAGRRFEPAETVEAPAQQSKGGKPDPIKSTAASAAPVAASPSDQADKEPAKSGESDEVASAELPSPETPKGSDKSSSETPSSPSESS